MDKRLMDEIEKMQLISFYINPIHHRAIKSLVRIGRYTKKSDFLREAVKEKLFSMQKEGIIWKEGIR